MATIRTAIVAFVLVLAPAWAGVAAETPAATNVAPAWLSQPLSLAEAIDIALQQNGTLLRARSDLQATYGVVVQIRAIVWPRLRSFGEYRASDQIESFPIFIPGAPQLRLAQEQAWTANVRLVQSIYEGGRITSSLRAARLTKEQALLQYQTVVADTILEVRIAYYDVLLAEQQIVVQEASVKLLTRELEDTTRRYEAGTVPRFNVLRAEVELANARPRLIRAQNAYRIAKNNLANLLGYRIPPQIWEDVPLRLTGKLEAEPFDIELPTALAQALERRTELGALRKAVSLRQEDIIQAKAGYKPSVQLFSGYGSRSPSLSSDLIPGVSGWNAGAQFTWDIFDGLLTQGRVQQAKALREGAQVTLDDTGRRVELEVRTAYSQFIEARQVLESQRKVVEQAEESLRLATSRAEAGTGTQLDVLSAQTALTDARTTQVLALRDYDVALARLQRAIGEEFEKLGAAPPPMK